jgi:hypothetical protein
MEKEFGIMPEAAENKLDKFKKNLIEEAEKKFGDIIYVSNKKNWDDCFTVEKDKIIFWFNTKKDGSTHMLRADLPN